MSRSSLRRVTPQHTTDEAIEIMRDGEDDEVMVVDAATKEPIGVVSRNELVQKCVRAWHEPARCRIGRHVGGSRDAAQNNRKPGETGTFS